jgi:hypothetical protein
MGLIKRWLKSEVRQHPLRAELPLRAALFSTEQMKQHGESLAGLHRVGDFRSPGQLLKRSKITGRTT